jgi:signal transduction histidine kinase
MRSSMKPLGEGPAAAIDASAHELLDGYAPGHLALLCPDERGHATVTVDPTARALATLAAIGAPPRLLREIEIAAVPEGRLACVVWGDAEPVLRVVDVDDLRARAGAGADGVAAPDPARREAALALAEAEDRVARLDTQIAVLAAAGWGKLRLGKLRDAREAVRARAEQLASFGERPDAARKEACDELSARLAEVRHLMLDFEGAGAVGRPLGADEPAAIDEACREVVRALEPRARARELVVRLDVPALPPIALDPGVVRAILCNLFVNAIHSCRAGAAIVVHARVAASGAFELTVADTGKGMTAEVYQRCTEPFFTTKPSGSGLGLAFARRAAEEAGGSLEIESVVDVGTSVTLRVPLR